ncbi:MAG: type II secretion system minor pseudopilin GspK [Proteobacteria bacterium]|nr:type II secretion system minor pseudopilin GspK [Pseudomonadota bacterium]
MSGPRPSVANAGVTRAWRAPPGRAGRPARAPRQAQRGVAMLAAILLVALGTVLAATVAYENAMTARRVTGVFAFENALAIGQGAEALAAYGLGQLTQSDPTSVYLGQGWDKPYGPLEIVPGVMLTAQLEDMQGRFNLNNLVDKTGTVNPVQMQAFTHLLELVGLEPKWAGYLATWIDYNDQLAINDGAGDSVYMGQSPPYRAAHRYITSTSELLALPGFGRERYLKLAPYVAALPPGTAGTTALNVCTASSTGVVLDAYLPPGVSQFSNGRLESDRAAAGPTCNPDPASVANVVTQYLRSTYPQEISPKVFDPGTFFAKKSNYFRLHSRISIGSTEFNLYSLLYFEQGQGARVLQRSFTPD